jgi:anthranilate synthase/phosphoribosyltransferase
VELPPEKAAQLLKRTGFAFLFAPQYHSAMKHAAEARKELRVKTVMNLLGPLINPAEASYQIIGVFDDRYLVPVAQAARILGVSRVMTVHALDGMDEISVTGPTRIVKIDESGIMTDTIFDPLEMGIPRYGMEELKGGSARDNAEVARAILSGGGHDAIREAVLLNAGAALHICGLAGSINEGYKTAAQALSTGKVKERLGVILREGEALAGAASGAAQAAAAPSAGAR